MSTATGGDHLPARWSAPCWSAVAAAASAAVRQMALVDRRWSRWAWRPCWWPSYPGGTEPFAATDLAWLDWTGAAIDIHFSIALDGLSLWLFALTALLMVVAVLVELGSDRRAGRRSTIGCC